MKPLRAATLRERSSRWLLALSLAAAFVATSAYAAGKPRVPPGRDPGGVAVAIIGPGVDYTDPAMAARLARDGEGELAGFDLTVAEGDRFPYELPSGSVPQRRISRLLAEAPAARLAVFRAPASLPELARAFVMVSHSPAVIVLADDTIAGALKAAELAAVSGRLAAKLVVVPAGGEPAEALPNVIRVRGCVRASAVCASAQAGTADIEAGASDETAMNEGAAAVSIAALAARLAAADSTLDGAGLKRKVLAAGVSGANGTVRIDDAAAVSAP